MSLFNIKLKTKAGNDLKKKEIFTVFFRLRFKKNGLTGKTTAVYTYRIVYSGGTVDPKILLEIKKPQEIMSTEDLTLKVLLNFCHLVGKISQAKSIDPDFIVFISPDLSSHVNHSWKFLSELFVREVVETKPLKTTITFDDLEESHKFKQIALKKGDMGGWTDAACKKIKIKRSELELLKSFVDINPNTKFMSIDPAFNPTKYQKSIEICNFLQDRVDGTVGKTKSTQITQEDEILSGKS